MAEAAIEEVDFLWEGRDHQGKRIKGEITGEGAAVVKAALRRQGIRPIRVRKKPKPLFGGRRSKKVKPADIAVFSRQLAAMTGAGVPLVQALAIIANGAEKDAMKKLVHAIEKHIEDGNTLAESLAQHPRHFDELFVNLVAAGEASGSLEVLLDKIATYKEKTEAIKGKVKKAMFYPAAVIIVAIIVTGILLYFVVPEFQSLFQGFGADLPAFTLMIIHLSHFVQSYWWLLLLMVAGAGYGFFYLRRRSRAFSRSVDRFSLKIPVIGNILTKAAIARYARTLSVMFSAGVPLVDALYSVGRASGNIVYEEGILTMRDRVATGQKLELCMRQTALFPAMATQMVAIGEESGSLDGMCAKVADFYEEEVDNKVDSLSTLLEPFIMVIIGALVGCLVIAMYLPIFQLGSVV
jgi:type IV pilus assembly protein PilC